MRPRALTNGTCYCGSTARMQAGKFSGHHSDELLWVNNGTKGEVGECAKDAFSLENVKEKMRQRRLSYPGRTMNPEETANIWIFNPQQSLFNLRLTAGLKTVTLGELVGRQTRQSFE